MIQRNIVYKVVKKITEKGHTLDVGDFLLWDMSVHGCNVKLASPIKKQEFLYGWFGGLKEFEANGFVVKPTKTELIKLSHHIGWRIWILSFVFLLTDENNKKDTGYKKLPMYMCYSCIKEGNNYLKMMPPREHIGECEVCGNITVLHRTIFGWPINLRHKGFGRSIDIKF